MIDLSNSLEFNEVLLSLKETPNLKKSNFAGFIVIVVLLIVCAIVVFHFHESRDKQ